MATEQQTTVHSVETAIHALGRAMWEQMRGEVPSVFDKNFWAGKILDWAMQDESFKLDVFRLIDVLPVLKTSRQINDHVQEYLIKEGRELPGAVRAALAMSTGTFTGKIAAEALKRSVTEMAHRFIMGTDARHAMSSLKKLHKQGFAFTVDLLGEATLSEAEAQIYEERYLDLITALSEEASKWERHGSVGMNHLGEVPVANISLKVSALDPHVNPVDPDGSVSRLLARTLPILKTAKRHNVFVNLDLEQWSYHNITYSLLERALSDPELKDWPHVGVVVQAYMKNAHEDAERMLALAQSRGTPITIRLVKGAYWDYEVIHANQAGQPVPVFEEKAATDANYEALTGYLLEHHDHLLPAFASHNLRSVVHAVALADEMKVPPSAYEFQTLYGMAEPLRESLRQQGHQVRIYCALGELLPGMGYLVRRLLENTSNESFLRQTYHEQVDPDALLAKPAPTPVSVEPPAAAGIDAPFRNCTLTDFSLPSAQKAFGDAVADMRATLPISVPVVVDGQARLNEDEFERCSPSEAELIVSRVSLAAEQDADDAADAATRTWPAWRDTPLRERAALLDRLADNLEADRNRLSALQVHEVGKPWAEADADVAEAIDFCRYYAREALAELGPTKQGAALGEDNVVFYEGRGPTLIIAPWNFPLAILCGMTTAALVAGNTVIMKPAETSSATGHALYQHMESVGFPKGVVQFLSGRGREVGAQLVNDPRIAQIAFTGSKEVGLSIVEQAAKTQPGQPQVRRVVCEMGGKNAIIVDDDADFDESVGGILKSAFGYAGQKCSACSRVLAVGTSFEPLVRRLKLACKSLTVCSSSDPACQIPAVVDAASYERLQAVLANPGEGAELLFRGEAPSGGYYIPPTLFAVTDPLHPLMQRELFGPIIAIMHVETYEEALDIACSTEFALTGAVYSRRPSHLDLARAKFRVGNLYLNRASTGAIVNRQPFGGFAMSGIGTKAGGPGYLRHFADPRCVTENTIRRGFSPDVSH